MSPSVAVVIGTFGDADVWGPLAQRAIASVEAQSRPVDYWTWQHSQTLARARNVGALGCREDLLVFLDADDELDPLYIERMLGASDGIRRPSTLGVYADGTEDERPVLIPERDLRTSNYIVIGAMHPRQAFFDVGGFDDLPALEDWALWRKLVTLGLEVIDVPEAVYRVHVRMDSRNRDPAKHRDAYARVLREIPM